jgi:hypothetical protein
MPIILVPGVPFYRNPQFRPGLAALVAFLMGRDYASTAIGKVFDFAATQGTLAGCEWLDPEDEAAAEEAFVDALPELDLTSDAWDRDTSVIFDVAMLAADVHPLPFGDGPDAPDADPMLAFPGARPLAERLGIPPVSGGAPEPEPFTPSEEDWRDYREHFDRLERVEPLYGYE